MASLWWHTEWTDMSLTEEPTYNDHFSIPVKVLSDKGYEVLNNEGATIDARQGDIEVVVSYSHRGSFTDAAGKTRVWVLKAIWCAAADDATSEATVNDLVDTIKGYGFL